MKPTAQQILTDSIRVANGLARKYTPTPAPTTTEYVRATVGPNNGGGSASAMSFGYNK